jgi:hypothetical protein
MVIWKDISVLYRAKEHRIKKIGGKLYRAFCLSVGEVPVGNLNEITGNFEPAKMLVAAPMEPGSASASAERRVLYRKQPSSTEAADPVALSPRKCGSWRRAMRRSSS